MTHSNKPIAEKSFAICKQYLKSAVPPCTATEDTPTHYEAVAINGDKNELFGYVVAHQNSATLGFSQHIPEKDMKQLFSDIMLKKMNKQRRIEVLDDDVYSLRKDIQNAITKLLYYYDEIGWTKV